MSYPELLNTITVATAVVGLVVVVISLQQTRRSINAASYQHILDREADNWNHVRSADKSVQLSALRHFGISLDKGTEHGTIELLLDHIALCNFYEGIYLQHRQGALDKEVWETWQRSMAMTMNNDEFRKTWESLKKVYSPKFVAYIEQVASLAPDAS